jgi:hypothetical protein
MSPAPASRYAPPQLDQMLAPVALYPDPVLAAVLMAASYPLEVVQADRWLQDGGNAQLQGAQLAQAVESQPWDASVKSLVAFPQILAMMDSALDWTQQVGEAFATQQADVMDSVQRLRALAQSARTLVPSPEQTVEGGAPAIRIDPAAPDTVYVPVYDPGTAYGMWPYPDSPPDDVYPPGYAFGSVVVFVIVAPLWGWNHWNWGSHGLVVGGNAHSGRLLPPGPPRPWRFSPEHRHGVPFQGPAVRAVGQQRTAGHNPQDRSGRDVPAGPPVSGNVQVPAARAPALVPARPALEPRHAAAPPRLPSGVEPPVHAEPAPVRETHEHGSRGE